MQPSSSERADCEKIQARSRPVCQAGSDSMDIRRSRSVKCHTIPVVVAAGIGMMTNSRKCPIHGIGICCRQVPGNIRVDGCMVWPMEKFVSTLAKWTSCRRPLARTPSTPMDKRFPKRLSSWSNWLLIRANHFSWRWGFYAPTCRLVLHRNITSCTRECNCLRHLIRLSQLGKRRGMARENS